MNPLVWRASPSYNCVAQPLKVVPMLSYEDVGAAADWLCSVFGFSEAGRFEDGGRVTHVNLVVADGAVMLGWPGPHYRSPKSHRNTASNFISIRRQTQASVSWAV